MHIPRRYHPSSVELAFSLCIPPGDGGNYVLMLQKRMNRLSSKRGILFFSALFFYLVLALFFFREAVFSDRVQVATDILMKTHPWKLAQPDAPEMRNPALSDQCTVFYPWFLYTKERLAQGEIPLWTPHSLGGVPYAGNLCSAIFYPLNLLIAVMPLTAFFLFQSILKVAAAGIFTYLLLRKLGLGYLASLFGGTVYALSGFTVLWVISHLTSVAVLMPALFWATEIFLERRNGPSLGLIALLLAVQFLGAQPEVSLCVVAAWLLYTLYRIRRASGWFTKEGARRLSSILLAALLSLGLVLFQLWPFLEYAFQSYGLQIRQMLKESRSLLSGGDPLFSMSGLGLMIASLLTLFFAARLFRLGKRSLSAFSAGALAGVCLFASLMAMLMLGMRLQFLVQVFPDLFGHYFDGVEKPGGAAYPEVNGGYAGILPLVLAAAAMMGCWRRSPIGIFTWLFLLSFGTVHVVPLIHHLVGAIPLFDICQPGRILCVTAFSVAVLGAFGLDYVLSRLSQSGQRMAGALRASGCLAAAFALLLAGGWQMLEVRFSGTDDLESAGIRLKAPGPGGSVSPEEGLRVRGKAGPKVEGIFLSVDGWGVGEASFDERNRFWFPAKGEGSRAKVLTRMREGLHQLVVKVKRSGGAGEDVLLVPINVTHPKKITFKGWAILLASLAVLVLLIVRRIPLSLRGSLAIIMAVVDLSLFGASYNCASDPDTLFPQTPVTRFLSAQEGCFRILPENAVLQPSTHYVYGYHVARGYDGLEVPEFNRLVNVMKRDPWVDVFHYNSKTLDYESPILDLLGIRYILSLDDLEGIKGFKRVHDGPLKVFKNTEALPRAFVAGHWVNISRAPEGVEEALAFMKPVLRKHGLDPEDGASRNACMEFLLKNYAFLERDIDLKGGGTGTVEIEEYRNEYVRVKATMMGGGVLILTDNFFPGWQVRVDGEEREILRSLAFRAVPLSDGEHEVEFFYRPPSFYGGAKISLACLVILCIIFISALFTRSR